jgi:hypothetical protein
MSHQNIKYEGTDAEKRSKAIKDLKKWFGAAKFNKVSRDIVKCEPPITRQQLRNMASIGGAEGYPVDVWADQLGLAPEPPATESTQDDS